jgi:hypothetical protein
MPQLLPTKSFPILQSYHRSALCSRDIDSKGIKHWNCFAVLPFTFVVWCILSDMLLSHLRNLTACWRMPSSGSWRRVNVVDWTDVSEDRITSIFRVEKSASEEPAVSFCSALLESQSRRVELRIQFCTGDCEEKSASVKRRLYVWYSECVIQWHCYSSSVLISLPGDD